MHDKISINVLGKEFLINCPAEAQAELIQSAQQLDQRMQSIKAGGKVFGLDRIAVMAALNLSHELLQTQRQLEALQQQQLQLSERISQALDNN